MKTRSLFYIAILGVVVALISAAVYNVKIKLQPPLSVNYNPYENGVYATGILESYQQNGSNINIFPDVSGRITKIFTKEGQSIKEGQPILAIDDSVQKEIVAKDVAQMQAALAVLKELKAQPRKETLEVVKAQLDFAQANLVNVRVQLDKIKKSYSLNSQSISKNTLDNAINAVKIAEANFKVAKTQYDLTKAGAWEYDIKTQENQYQAAQQAYLADRALLEKYLIRAPADGVILQIKTAVGDYVSQQGIYDTYSRNQSPIATLGRIAPIMEVRCYLNEILTPRLPAPENIKAEMFIRGSTNKGIPLTFERIQPYTIPNIELSAEKSERVDVRVLPIIFKFQKPKDINLYPGQLVDVYIGVKK